MRITAGARRRTGSTVSGYIRYSSRQYCLNPVELDPLNRFSRLGHKIFEHGQLADRLRAPYRNPNFSLEAQDGFSGYTCNEQWLPTGVRTRAIGDTSHRPRHEGEFLLLSWGLQARSDFARRRPPRWLAIDDNEEGWRQCIAVNNSVIEIRFPIGFWISQLDHPDRKCGRIPNIAAVLPMAFIRCC